MVTPKVYGKLLPNGSSIFRKEVYMYKEIAPAYKVLESECGIPETEISDIFAECHGSRFSLEMKTLPQLPASDNSTLLPIMVYSIGGGFTTGNHSIQRFGPDFILDKDVVLVVPSFRVEVLGFLSTGDAVSPGNYGLNDIVCALKWVQNNIEYFGGDPSQVTIFGGSSGAIAIHLLAISNLTDGKGCRAASASQANKLGEYLGCPTNTSTLLVDCIRSVNASQLVHSESLFYVWRSFPFNVWNPTIEPDIEGAVLIDSPENLSAAGKIRDLPWIAGVNRDEGLVFSAQFYENPDAFEGVLNDIDLVLPAVLGYGNIVDDVTAYTAALKSFYLNDLTADRSLLLSNYTKLNSDALVIYPANKAFRQHLVRAKSPHYFYSFEYRGAFSHNYVFSGGSTRNTGVAHGDELVYLFKNHDLLFAQ